MSMLLGRGTCMNSSASVRARWQISHCQLGVTSLKKRIRQFPHLIKSLQQRDHSKDKKTDILLIIIVLRKKNRCTHCTHELTKYIQRTNILKLFSLKPPGSMKMLRKQKYIYNDHKKRSCSSARGISCNVSSVEAIIAPARAMTWKATLNI